MLKLFAGRENIDKERFIYDRIRECGGETLVLVPNQYTLVAEEQALKYLGSDCLFDIEILSMNRLGLRILTEQGTESVRMLDKYGRFMLLTMLIREHMDDFDIFRRSAGKLSFTAMLNDFISEFRQQDCTLEQLQNMIEELLSQKSDPILSAKLQELIGVISAYEEAIEGRYTDAEGYIAMYVSAIKNSKLVRGRNIWIYGYDSITPKFADAVMELARSAESVGFIVNQSDFGLDERLTAFLRGLASERGVDISFEMIDPSYALPKAETVARIDRYLWRDVLTPEEKAFNAAYVPEGLTLVCAANPYYEAETAAAYIWHLVRDLGYKMNEIQVIANDEGAMQPVIRRVFAEYGLPVFADTSRDITDSAAVSFIVSLLEFVRSRKVSSYLFAMLKTGLSGFPDEDIEELENYVRDYRIRGSMWDKPFRYGREDIGSERFDRLEAMRAEISGSAAKLAALASPKMPNASNATDAPNTSNASNTLNGQNSGTVSEFIKNFKNYLDDEWQLSARVADAAAAQDEAGLHDEAQRMTQSFEKAIDILGQVDEIMGESELELAGFTEIYTAGLTDVEVGVIPPTVDGLSMGTMIRTRPRQMRAAVILGANEGVMPLSPNTEGLFSVDEKKYFRDNGFALGSLEDIKADEEQAAMQRMMARPSEKIYISYSMTDTEGGDASPSPVIESLKALFPRIEEDGLVCRDIISEGWGGSSVSPFINTADDSMRHLINRIREGGAQPGADHLTRALTGWYQNNRPQQLGTMMRAAAYDNDLAPLMRPTAKELFGRRDGSLVMSASSISGYIDCPFKYFVDRGLRPKEERSFASDSRSVGDIYHECLMAVARQIMGDRGLLERLRAGGMDVGAPEGRAEAADRPGAVTTDPAGGSDPQHSPAPANTAGGSDPLESLVSAALDNISQSYRGGLFISTGSESYRMDRIREICGSAVRAMAGQLTAESVTGSAFEEGFSRRGMFSPISMKVGDDDVYVEGRIDRADFINVGGEERVRIIDYKTGADRLDLNKMRQGLKMQLMIYLISATGEREPAGMFYFNIKDPIESVNDKSQSQIDGVISREAGDEFKLRGAFIDEEGVLGAMPEKVLSSAKGGITREEYEEVRADVLKRIEETASGILSGRIGINPLKDNNKLVCNYCSYKSVCRRDRGYVKNAARTITPKEK